MNLAETLRKLRGDKSLLYVEKGTGISRVQIMRFEKGRRLPKVTPLKKLAEFFQVPFQDLASLAIDALVERWETEA